MENLARRDYRAIKPTVVGPDDYASEAVIRRRWASSDGLTPPDLIVIDGGQGQVNIAAMLSSEELG